jgi:hypothetical protein
MCFIIIVIDWSHSYHLVLLKYYLELHFIFASARNITFSTSLILLKIVVFGKIQWLN